MPQKSLAYKRIGFTSVSSSFRESNGNCIKSGPNFFLIFIKAFNALSFKSFSPELISPEGVIKNPRYLYFLVDSNFSLPNGNDLLMCLPFLLKIITLVLSTFILIPFSSVGYKKHRMVKRNVGKKKPRLYVSEEHSQPI